MSSKVEPQLRPGQVLAHRVKEARKRRGWSQQKLAERLKELGYPLPRSTLAKIEQGETRSDARLGDVLALAAALGVAPVHLVVPLEDETEVMITPKLPMPAVLARAWIRGYWPLEDAEPGAYLVDEIPDSELAQRLTRGLTPLQRALMAERTAERVVEIREQRESNENADPDEEEDDDA